MSVAISHRPNMLNRPDSHNLIFLIDSESRNQGGYYHLSEPLPCFLALLQSIFA